MEVEHDLDEDMESQEVYFAQQVSISFLLSNFFLKKIKKDSWKCMCNTSNIKYSFKSNGS